MAYLSADKEVKATEVGKRIREVRGSLSQAELGRILGVTKVSISNYERGRIPHAYILAKIARFGHTTIDWLLTGREKITEPQKLPYSAVAEKPAIYQIDDPELARLIQELKRNPSLISKLLRLLKGGRPCKRLLEEIGNWDEKRITAFIAFLKSGELSSDTDEASAYSSEE